MSKTGYPGIEWTPFKVATVRLALKCYRESLKDIDLEDASPRSAEYIQQIRDEIKSLLKDTGGED